MEDKTMKMVNEFLLSEGTTWADLSKTQKKLFERVAPIVVERESQNLIGKQILKDNAINQSAIAKAIDVERKTVGSNNPLVAKFIDKHSTNEPKGDVSGARYSALQKELAEFKAQYDAMVSHIVDIENLRAELKVEKDRVAEKEVQIANFEKENAELRVALDKYRRADMDTLIKYSSDSRNKS